MTNDPVLIAYTVKDRPEGQKAIWRRIGIAFPHDKGAGLTVLLDALPIDGRIVLVEPKIDPDQFAGLRDAPPVPPNCALERISRSVSPANRHRLGTNHESC
jgi:hypothetical protein